MNNDGWELAFYDGANNAFFLRKDTAGNLWMLEYRPVEASQSSSGVYSGGDPKTAQLTGSEAEGIRKWVRELAADRHAHVERRSMGSGLFVLKDGRTELRFILPASQLLEHFASELRNKLDADQVIRARQRKSGSSF